MTNGNEIRRAALNRAVLATLRENGVAVWEVRKRELLDAFGHPPLHSRKELRQILTSIVWPMLNGDTGNDQILDAAALGMLVQTERSFLY